MSVTVDDEETFRVAAPVKLFDWPSVGQPGPARTYDVTADGQRFLMIKEPDAAQPESAVTPASSIVTVVNWQSELP